MLTKLEIRNFKRFDSVEIELGNPVVFIGPNNSGKTTALQALALWGLALGRCREVQKPLAEYDGFVLNRKDLVDVPVPDAMMLWRDLQHKLERIREGASGRVFTYAPIGITVGGSGNDGAWRCAFQFQYANQESISCLPMGFAPGVIGKHFSIPTGAEGVRMAFLPPMSGLTDLEFLKHPGEISYLIGQGRTGEVLRNLCYRARNDSPDGEQRWASITESMQKMFGVALSEPLLSPSRASIEMTYHDRSGVELDLSCTGRGALQTLLLLAYMSVNPGAVLLLDEPDAHLEVLRQEEIYRMLSEEASRNGSQVIIASHSEVILRNAAKRDAVVAFIGKPHRVEGQISQVLKALSTIRADEYEKAEMLGWVLYLEGSTDLAVLRAFAERLQHPVRECLARPFFLPILNQPKKAHEHFGGLSVAKPDLLAFQLTDHLRRQLRPDDRFEDRMWNKREIENYLCQPETLYAYAESLATDGPDELSGKAVELRSFMQECVAENAVPAMIRDPNDPRWATLKASDEFLKPVFDAFFAKLTLPNRIVRGMAKADYHRLVPFIRTEDIDPEVTGILDAIQAVSQRANPHT
jgi:ABC-type cobalamin transport system ATPase subunit